MAAVGQRKAPAGGGLLWEVVNHRGKLPAGGINTNTLPDARRVCYEPSSRLSWTFIRDSSPGATVECARRPRWQACTTNPCVRAAGGQGGTLLSPPCYLRAGPYNHPARASPLEGLLGPVLCEEGSQCHSSGIHR